ncbi:MAG: Fe-S cluster assembly sulfur transfer protein SufU [Myxococcota bacterium]
MSDLRDLYQEVILDHTRRPRNFGPLEGATHCAQGYNPLCGDKIEIRLIVDGDQIRDVHFQGSGCAISTASASLMTEALRGRSVAEARDLFERFHGVVASDASPDTSELGKLAVMGGVREFPMRVKCATLAWHTLQAALERKPEPATTE